MFRSDVLSLADELINGERQADYGTPADNLGCVARMWSAFLGAPVAPWQVAACMAMLKLARLKKNPEHDDSWVDAAAYLALGSELATPLD